MMSRRSLLKAAAPLLLPQEASAFVPRDGLRATLRANYLARQFGIFHHFNMATFTECNTANDGTSPNQDPNSFNPGSTFSTDQWLAADASAKANYACYVAKHVDGFCPWLTSSTTYNVSASSWYGTYHIDVVQAFVTSCAKYGLAPVLYFSVTDSRFELENGYDGTVAWHTAHQSAYRSYLTTQITELLSNYGPIAALWTDAAQWNFIKRGVSPTSYPWNSPVDLLNLVHGLQSNCLLVNNSHTGDFSDSDVVEYEQLTFVPSGNTNASENCAQYRSDLFWFWHTVASAPVATATVLNYLATNNARNCNLLLNAGPNTSGLVPSEMVSGLAAIGAR